MAEDLVLALFLFLSCLCGWVLVQFARRVRKLKTPARWPQLLAGNAIVLAFLFSLILLSGEMYYRFFYDSSDSLSFTKTSRRWFQRHCHNNAVGIRDNIEYSPGLSGGRRRISFVGDSFTAGHGIKEVENRFVNIIRHAHPEWEVHMLARPGLDTGDEISDLWHLSGKGYQFDRVVLVYCLNDVADLMPEWDRALLNKQAEKSGWFLRNSYFVNTLYNRWQVSHNPLMKSYFGFVIGAYRGPLWQKQQERLKEFREGVEFNGGRLSVVTFPFLHALGPSYEYQFVHEELNQFWRELNVPHLDLLTIYKDIPAKKLTVNHFDVHPNEYAHALAAAAIDKFLKQQLETNSIPVGN